MPDVRKHLLGEEPAQSPAQTNEIDIAATATIGYSSEDPAHPIDNMIDGRYGAGATRWVAAAPNTTEQILFSFDEPQTLARIAFEVEETQRERTQEIRIEVSTDNGATYRQILMQQYSFSPGGGTLQREDLRFDLSGVTHVLLRIVPNQSGSGTATVTSLRLFS